MQRPVYTPLGKGTPVPAGRGKSWSHLSLCLFCLGCDRTITMGGGGPRGEKWEECSDGHESSMCKGTNFYWTTLGC
ncbi:hypothetical protein DPMN_144539 [Dreissena polymorpha]|uniref:Uncharacterized protein n=1 Tax=Dreissena polymorpha TaxID=45954 RepID=A0A9D4GID2_DREPO|nr:hypothetical protein DPMN_144539 [Dreissena polymorpha]